MTLRDLRLAPDAVLQPIFGRYVAQIRARAAGIDDRPVIADWDEKQISAEETFDIDLARSRANARASSRSSPIEWRRDCAPAAGSPERVVVKIRRKDFKTYTRQRAVRPATHETRALALAAAQLLDEWLRRAAARRGPPAGRRRARSDARAATRSVRDAGVATQSASRRRARRHPRQVRHRRGRAGQLAAYARHRATR